MDLGLGLLLLLMSFYGIIYAQHQNETIIMPPRCMFAVEDPEIYERKCHGSYPMLANLKYKDRLIGVGEPISLYISRSTECVLLVHKDSRLHGCHNLQVKDSNTFICLDNRRDETIVVKMGEMFCLPFPINLPYDLMNECLVENKVGKSKGLQFLNDILRTRRTILYYVHANDGSGAERILPIILPYLCMCVFLRPL